MTEFEAPLTGAIGLPFHDGKPLAGWRVLVPRGGPWVDALNTDDERTRAHALWARRFGVPPRDDREKARQIRFLIARGYPGSIAFDVIRTAASVSGRDAEAS